MIRLCPSCAGTGTGTDAARSAAGSGGRARKLVQLRDAAEARASRQTGGQRGLGEGLSVTRQGVACHRGGGGCCARTGSRAEGQLGPARRPLWKAAAGDAAPWSGKGRFTENLCSFVSSACSGRRFHGINHVVRPAQVSAPARRREHAALSAGSPRPPSPCAGCPCPGPGPLPSGPPPRPRAPGYLPFRGLARLRCASHGRESAPPRRTARPVAPPRPLRPARPRAGAILGPVSGSPPRAGGRGRGLFCSVGQVLPSR